MLPRSSFATLSLSDLTFIQGGVELPANWQPGDQALPVNLEDKMDFLGIDVTTEEEKEERAGYMGEPKVEQKFSRKSLIGANT